MSFRRFAAIATRELGAGLTGPLFWVLVVGLVLSTLSLNPAALIPSGDPTTGGARPFTNSAFAMATVFALTALLLYGFVASILAGMSVIRDDEHRLSDLLHGTPLTTTEYVAGKFAGTVSVLGVALVLHGMLAILVFQLMPVGDASTVRGPFRLGNFLVPALTLGAPPILYSAGLAFAVGERTRKPLFVALVPIAQLLVCLFFLWQWTPTWLAPAVDRLLMILDPSGLRWLSQTVFRVDRGVDFYNTRAIPFDGTFLLNRLVTLAIPCAAVLASIPHCRRLIAQGGVRGGSRDRAREEVLEASERDRPLAELGMQASPPGFIASTFFVVRAELRELSRSPVPYLFTLLVMSMVWESAASATAALDAPVWMTAGSLAVGALERISVSLCLLLLFHGAESWTRDRTSRFDAIFYATPVPTGALLMARCLTAGALVGFTLAGCLLGGTGFLLLQGGGPLELWPFLLVWGGILSPSLVAWQAFVVAVVSITRDRYATYAIGLTALLLSAWHHAKDSMSWVFNWNLWGTLHWSDLATFDLDGRALLLNRATTIALAVLLLAVAARTIVRTERDAARVVERLATRRLLVASARLMPYALPLVLVGAWLQHEIDTGFQGDAAEGRRREYWRRNVATWRDHVPPTLEHVDLRLELAPERRQVAVDGTLRLANQTGVPLRRLVFTVDPEFRDVRWSVGGSDVDFENRSGLHVLDLNRPLGREEEVVVGFGYHATLPRGVSRNGGGGENFVLPSGTVLQDRGPGILPKPGFLPGYGVPPDQRPAPREVPADFWKAELEPAGGLHEPFTTRVQVTAPSEYTVTSIGVKTLEREHDGRRTVVWESDHPVKALNVAAGRWKVRREQGTAVYYHPGHPHNIDEISATLVAARRAYSEWFRPYPWRELRINQFPGHTGNARSYPTNILFSERIGFLARNDDRAPLAFVVTAHEVAHQWWGHLLTPGDGPGADVLIEGMAHYATLLLLESERGSTARAEFARTLETTYVSERRVDAERPLVRLGEDRRPGDRTLVYDKSAWVMWMLHQQLGADGMLRGLQEFLARYEHSPDHPALHDLIETLRPHAADGEAYQAFVDQWFFDVVTPELRILEVTASPADRGWEVVATLEQAGTGAVTVDVAVIGDAAESRASVSLVSGESRRISWAVDFEPERVVVDPDVQLLQLNRVRATRAIPLR